MALEKLDTTHKTTSKQTEDLARRPELIILEQNTGYSKLDVSLGDGFLEAKATRAKINRWIRVKLEGFCTGKETTNKTRRI